MICKALTVTVKDTETVGLKSSSKVSKDLNYNVMCDASCKRMIQNTSGLGQQMCNNCHEELEKGKVALQY